MLDTFITQLSLVLRSLGTLVLVTIVIIAEYRVEHRTLHGLRNYRIPKDLLTPFTQSLKPWQRGHLSSPHVPSVIPVSGEANCSHIYYCWVDSFLWTHED